MSRPQLNLCGKITTIAFIVLNFIFLLIGLALIGGGSYLVHTGSNLDFFTGSRFFSGAVIIIVAGIITFLITIVGIVGAILLNKFLLGLYLIAVVLIVILEIVAGVLGFVYREQVEDQSRESALRAIEEYTVDGSGTVVNRAIDEIQKDFKCCGWDEALDWITTNYFNVTAMYPESCVCNLEDEFCEPANITQQNIYNRGCQEGVVQFFQDNLIAAGGIGVAFGLLEILAILMALGLCICVMQAGKGYTTV